MTLGLVLSEPNISMAVISRVDAQYGGKTTVLLLKGVYEQMWRVRVTL